MPILTDKNTQYGPPLVNQKYAPLRNIDFQATDQTTYSALMVNRAKVLRSANRLGKPLRLATPGWPAVVAAEAGHLPPLVVISSNRAGWIRAGLDAAQLQLQSLNIAAFTNASDLRALTARAGQTVSPPIYAPSRVGANRNVYVVVQMMEYRVYQRALAGSGITPVGWEFDRGGGGPKGLSLVGFGASRFAAMEFCKLLRRLAAAAPGAGGVAPWDWAWLVDDNVVALTNFAGFAAVEAAVLPTDVCAGFQGGTKAETQASNVDLATRELARGGPVPPLPPSRPPGIVQQMSMWNVDYLDRNHLNFGPIYVASAEDLSITNYFNAQGIPYKFYDGIGVVKEEATQDTGSAGQKVNRARDDIAAFVAAAESASPPGTTPPPPVSVQPREADDGGVQNLADFIVNRVLPNSLVREKAGNVGEQNKAKCQAVEQLTCGAINLNYVTQAATTAAFQINGANQQVVVQVNLP